LYNKERKQNKQKTDTTLQGQIEHPTHSGLSTRIVKEPSFLIINKKMAFKIYTKSGDQGETGLFGGKRLPKSHLRIESYGTVDELNSWIGLVRDLTDYPKTEGVLEHIQNRLFTVGSNLASDPSKAMNVPKILLSDIELLEKEIDRMEADLPPLKAFILPGGHPTVSNIHIARCVCRRAERSVVGLGLIDEVPDVILQYLNRLSDYLFVLARWVGMRLDAKEIKWVAPKS